MQWYSFLLHNYSLFIHIRVIYLCIFVYKIVCIYSVYLCIIVLFCVL
nr:MAG TPA: hypothetical protein [Caudoviricetes sp.]